MKYTTVYVKQLENRKGKSWQARTKYKDVYGKWKEALYRIIAEPDGYTNRQALIYIMLIISISCLNGCHGWICNRISEI